MKSNALFLEPGIAYELHTIQSDLAGRGLLPSPELLWARAAPFRERFGVFALERLDSEALLRRLHGREAGDDSLICRLEKPCDDTVGSLGGGSAFRGDLFFSRVRGGWIGGTPTDSRLLSIDEAIERALRHRDEMIGASRTVEQMSVNGDEDAYRALQAEIDRAAPTIGDTSWGHKYLSQLFPNLLDPFHAPDVQRLHLLRLLLTPPDDLRRTRYAMAGLFEGVAQALDVPQAHLGALLTARHGRRSRAYWRVTAGAAWEAMLRDGYVALPEGAAGHVRPGDVVVAMDAGGAVQGLGVVRPRDGYQKGDRVPVEWQSIEPWTLPLPPRSGASVRGLTRRGENVREIERHLLADTAPFHAALPAARSRRGGSHAASHLAAVRVAEERQAYSAQEASPTESPLVPLPPLTTMTARIASVLARKGQVILHGPPGTGKTWGAEAAARELAARSWFGVAANRLTPAQASALTGEGGDSGLGLPPGGVVRLVCFHPAYGYEDFLEGYRPAAAEITHAGAGSELRFERRDGIFKQLCRDAAAYTRGDFFLIVDEINRGDTPRIFGELLTVLEPGKRGRHVLLPLSGESFAVPPNVYLIGTMNTTDRSIALLDAALRRRFGFVETPPNLTLLASACIEGLPLASWVGALNRRLRERLGADGRQAQIGHAYFLRPDGTPIDDLPTLTQVLREDIVPLIEEHTYEDPDLMEALLGAALVDARTGTIRDEIFTPGREEDLLRALIATLPSDEPAET